MIIVTLLLAVIILVFAMINISSNVYRSIVAAIAIFIMLASMIFMVKNDKNHLGMNKTTTSSSKNIYSVAPNKNMQMLLYKAIGTKGTDRVYVYKKHQNDKKPSHTGVEEDLTNKIKSTSSNKAKLVTKILKWKYKNNTSKLWFGVSGNSNDTISKTNIFYLPKTWNVLSTDQTKKLQKLSKQQQPKMKKEAGVYVQSKVKQAMPQVLAEKMKQNPNMTAQEKQKLTKSTSKELANKYALEYQMQATKKLIKQVKK